MRHTAPAVVVALTATIFLAGCIEVAEPEASPSSDADVIEMWIQLAKEEGVASEDQIGILEQALDAGQVTMADVDAAAAEMYQCLEDAGLDYIRNDSQAVAGSGVWLPAPMVVANDPNSNIEGDLLADCQGRHEIYVASAFAGQISVEKAEAKVWLSNDVRACLEERGYLVDADAKPSEVEALNFEDISTHATDPAFTPCVTNAESVRPEDIQ